MGETRLSFKRYEKKYLLSAERCALLMERLRPRIEPDEYFRSTVCSLYYDTPDCRLIRLSHLAFSGRTYRKEFRNLLTASSIDFANV